MLFEDLITTKKISYEEAEIYRLFALEGLGRSWFLRMVHDTFMDCAPPPMLTTEILAYCDGRRSIMRDVFDIINKVELLMKRESV